MFANVAVDFADANRLRTYTYAVPHETRVGAGDLVWVPFGYRPIQGIVTSLADSTDVADTKPIESVVEDGPFLSTHHLRLCDWVAEYYRTSWFRTAELFLPPSTTSKLRIWVSRTSRLSDEQGSLAELRLSDSQLEVLQDIPDGKRVRRDRLSKSAVSKRQRDIDALVRDGYLLSESIWERPAGKFRNVAQLRLTPGADPDAAVVEYRRRGATARQAVLEAVAAAEQPLTRADAAKRFGQAAVKSVIDDGVVEVVQVRVDRDPLSEYAAQESIVHELTHHQQACIDAIAESLQGASQPDGRRYLLHGVTGSGKTEIYLRAVSECIASGRRAIVTVPEIAMTPQMLQRFASRFPGRIALQHSGLSLGQRFDQWHKVRAGDYDVVLGSRSSIFAPVSQLGLVVMDEEHEWTFKQSDRAPRYHARDVAERLCDITGATLVLGSATPDLATYHRSSLHDDQPSARAGYRRLELPYRINQPQATMHPPARHASSNGVPQVETVGGGGTYANLTGVDVEVVDMRREFDAGHRELLSRSLIAAMRENTALGRKTILFINRRGSASFVQCVHCGTIRRCPNCQASLTLHRRSRDGRHARLQCHYCSYSVGATRECRTCGRVGVARRAAGTEGAEEAVQAFFPDTPVIRWDSDTARNSREHTRILEQFQAAGPQILVGTQMVAKGLDIPSVGLVGVLAADISLAIPSYRSPERTFQLIAQVVGRAGRSDMPGRAIIQTFLPEHPAIVRGAAQDYAGFYESEILTREKSGLPPFVRQAKLTCAAYQEDEARAEAASVLTRLSEWTASHGDGSEELIGPTPAFPFRRGGRYRFHLFVSIAESPNASLNPMLDAVELSTAWTVEIDPLDMA